MKKYGEKRVALPHATIQIKIVCCETIIEKKIYKLQNHLAIINLCLVGRFLSW